MRLLRSRLLLDEERVLEEELEALLELFDPRGVLRFWQDSSNEEEEEDSVHVSSNIIESTSSFHFHEMGLDLGEFTLGGNENEEDDDEQAFPVGSFSHALLRHVKQSNNSLDRKFSSLVLSLAQVRLPFLSF